MADEPQGTPEADDPSQTDPTVEGADAAAPDGDQPVNVPEAGVPDGPAEPKEAPVEPAGGDDAAGFDQSDIDALLAADGEGEPSEAVAASETKPDATLGQDSTANHSEEAATGNVGEAATDGVSAPAEAAGGDFDEFDQSDIDALLAAAGGDAPQGVDAASGPSTPAPPAADTRLDSAGRPFDEAAALMAAAIAEEKEAAAALAAQNPPEAPLPQAPMPEADPFSMPDFASSTSNGNGLGMDMLNDVQLHVKIELGRTRMLVEDVLKLGNGSVVELDRLAGDPVDVFANERLVARGEVLVLNDNFCVRISEIISPDKSEDGDE